MARIPRGQKRSLPSRSRNSRDSKRPSRRNRRYLQSNRAFRAPTPESGFYILRSSRIPQLPLSSDWNRRVEALPLSVARGCVSTPTTTRKLWLRSGNYGNATPVLFALTPLYLPTALRLIVRRLFQHFSTGRAARAL